jgi:hypothetical protein
VRPSLNHLREHLSEDEVFSEVLGSNHNAVSALFTTNVWQDEQQEEEEQQRQKNALPTKP